MFATFSSIYTGQNPDETAHRPIEWEVNPVGL